MDGGIGPHDHQLIIRWLQMMSSTGSGSTRIPSCNWLVKVGGGRSLLQLTQSSQSRAFIGGFVVNLGVDLADRNFE